MIEYINQSLLNSWDLCPERVRRRWIEGEIIPPGIAATIGTGVHGGIEVNHKAKIKTGLDEPKDVILDAARDAYVKKLNEEGVWFPPDEVSSARKKIAEGLDVTVHLAGLYADKIAPLIIPTMVEEEIYLPDLELPIPWRGTLDVYTQDRWLPDFKTASSRWQQAKADASYQATLYRELVKIKTGEYPKKITFEILVKNKKPIHQSLKTERTNEDFQMLRKKAKLVLTLIQSGTFPPAPQGSWTCSPKWCGYWWTCPWIPAHKKILPKKSVK